MLNLKGDQNKYEESFFGFLILFLINFFYHFIIFSSAILLIHFHLYFLFFSLFFTYFLLLLDFSFSIPFFSLFLFPTDAPYCDNNPSSSEEFEQYYTSESDERNCRNICREVSMHGYKVRLPHAFTLVDSIIHQFHFSNDVLFFTTLSLISNMTSVHPFLQIKIFGWCLIHTIVTIVVFKLFIDHSGITSAVANKIVAALDIGEKKIQMKRVRDIQTDK